MPSSATCVGVAAPVLEVDAEQRGEGEQEGGHGAADTVTVALKEI